MTLDDFRRKYESMNGGKRPQSAAKPAAAKTQTAKPANAESAPKRQTVRPPQASPGQMNGAGSVQKAPNASNVPNAAEQRPKQQKAAAKQPPQKKSVPVRSVDIGSQAKESPVIAGVMAHKNDLHTEFGADAVAFVQGKNLSPMQQGLLWAEILGPPKAKQRRGGRY